MAGIMAPMQSEARSTAAEAARRQAHEVLPVLMTTEKDFYKSFDDSVVC